MEMAVALGAGGRALVARGSQGQAEESGPYDVRASVRVRDGARFGPAARWRTAATTRTIRRSAVSRHS